MNPHQQFCPNTDCAARGKVGAGHIVSYSQKEQRCRCTTCGRTFSIRQGTALYGIKHSMDLFGVVVTLLAHGCPLQAIVAAFGLDERTVRSWYLKAGTHCQPVHDQIVGHSQLDLGQVQADEIKVKTQQGRVWLALALMVSTRLWLGGVVSSQRDKRLIGTLLAVDGLVSDVAAFHKAFRTPLPTGKRGRRRLIPWQGIHIVQVVKRRTAKGLTLERRIVQGDALAVAACLKTSQGGGQINTAFIERLNATFRQSLACLGRRSRSLARQTRTLQAGMFLVGCLYNFCHPHASLRLPLWISERRCHWVQRTPAMAAGLTDHGWSVLELLTFKVPPPPFVPPKRRGRPPKRTLLEAAP